MTGRDGAWRRTRFSVEAARWGRALAQQAASRGRGRCPASHWLPHLLPAAPPGWEPGSCRKRERSKAVRVLVTMANTGENKNPPKPCWCRTSTHAVQVRLGACTHVCVWARVCARVGTRVLPCTVCTMHKLPLKKQTASLEKGRFFEFQLAVSTMSV